MMKIKIIKTLAILILAYALNFPVLLGQIKNDSTTKYVLSEQYEKVSFTIDRDLYLSGETIWFTSQCLLAHNNHASPLSTVIYIELFNADKKPFIREKFGLIEGKANGNLQIPAELPTGIYFLRAYTQFLRNFQIEVFPTKIITVINPENPLPQDRSQKNDSIAIMPEGMGLVRNLPGRVGIRIPETILPRANAFYITNEHQKILDSIYPYANGLAGFDFIPADSVDYYLKVQYTNSESQLIRFPEIAGSGFSMQTEVSGSNLFCIIKSTPGLRAQYEKLYFQLVSENVFELGTHVLTSVSDTQTVKIPLSWRSEGINHAVLMSDQRDVLQYRCFYYLNPKNKIELPIKLDKNTYTPRELIAGKIDVIHNSYLDTVFLTVAVVKSGTIENFDGVLPWKFIENPGFAADLFISKKLNPEIHRQLEIAYILKGPDIGKKINQSVHQGMPEMVYMPELRDVTVSGYIREKESGAPISGKPVFSSVLFGDFQVHGSTTSDDGSFVFTLNNLTGDQDLYVYAGQSGELEQEILINSGFSNDFPNVSDAFHPPDSSSAQLIEEMWTELQVTKHFPHDSAVQYNWNKSLPFLFGKEMITIRLDDYISLTSMKEVFTEIIPFVKLRETDGHYRFSVFNTRTEMLFRDPLIILDHIPFINPDEIMKIHPSMVDNIGVIDKVYVLGDNVFQGVISINTRTKDFAGVSFPAASAFTEFQTLTPASRPIFPVYDTIQNQSNRIPDFRTLLYWDSDRGITNDCADFGFYSSDRCSDYDIIVSGYNQKGERFFGKATFKVIK
jgi:hypothetical protein